MTEPITLPRFELSEDELKLTRVNLDAEVKLLNPGSWTLSVRYTFYTAASAIIGFAGYNKFYKRPFYHAIFQNSLFVVGTSAIAYFYGRFIEQGMVERDAVISHYMQLHPEDFDHLRPENVRKYRDVFLPWYPLRVQERFPQRYMDSQRQFYEKDD